MFHRVFSFVILLWWSAKERHEIICTNREITESRTTQLE